MKHLIPSSELFSDQKDPLVRVLEGHGSIEPTQFFALAVDALRMAIENDIERFEDMRHDYHDPNLGVDGTVCAFDGYSEPDAEPSYLALLNNRLAIIEEFRV